MNPASTPGRGLQWRPYHPRCCATHHDPSATGAIGSSSSRRRAIASVTSLNLCPRRPDARGVAAGGQGPGVAGLPGPGCLTSPSQGTTYEDGALRGHERPMRCRVAPAVAHLPRTSVGVGIVLRMFSGIGGADWASMHHAHGSAEEVPTLLEALRSPDAGKRGRTISDFYSKVPHQGDAGPCQPRHRPSRRLAASPRPVCRRPSRRTHRRRRGLRPRGRSHRSSRTGTATTCPMNRHGERVRGLPLYRAVGAQEVLPLLGRRQDGSELDQRQQRHQLPEASSIAAARTDPQVRRRGQCA
ncbi:hypothetical protein GA0070611_0696 [Micromonospora auratinigra]|uniref:Uncharacterized protein n=1 Tax=Micromonospora auratinigra TaxID=261654 RepID=A0A1A8Z4W6_9ACTN|nr:hypothetical protein GA0070611_0696 [Micromonospora auratinigra]